MSRTPARTLFVLFAFLAALITAAGPATAGTGNKLSSAPGGLTEPAGLPLFALGSCKDIQTLFPFAPDGVYPVHTGNHVLTVYCHDMAGTPRDYIELARTGEDVNFSQYTAGGASPGTNVRTWFTKLRIDPATMTVDIGDLTFAGSAGRLQHSSVTRGPSSPFVTSMPYGVAMSCSQRPDGVGNINLQGTPFVVDDTFEVRSFAGSGSANMSEDKQTVDLNVSGYCGWIAATPAIDTGYNPAPNNFRLNLACAPPDSQTGQPARQYCLSLS